MLFRRRKKPSVVTYTFDERYSRAARENYQKGPKSMEDQTMAFNAWCSYPAMKTCDMIRKLPTFVEGFGFNTVEDEKICPMSASDTTTNQARYNLNMWDKVRSMLKNPTMADAQRALSPIITGIFQEPSKTIRACPPIKDLLTQTLLVKCPTDIHFAKGNVGAMYGDVMKVQEDQKDADSWHWISPAYHVNNQIDLWGEFHAQNQFCYGEGSQMEGYTNLKINTGLSLYTPENVTVMMIQPVFHNIGLPMNVIPGIFMYPFNQNVAVIPNFFIHKDTEDFILKKGDALCYLTFSENVTFKPDETGADRLSKFAFNAPQMSWKKLSGKMRHDGKD